MGYKTSKEHRITWYVWAWNGSRSERMRHTATMRGRWGWDAECSCGWGSHTGGATRGSVERDVWHHKHIDADGPLLPIVSTGPSRTSVRQADREALIARLEARS